MEYNYRQVEKTIKCSKCGMVIAKPNEFIKILKKSES